MAPERWTTGEEQLSFLKERLSAYCEHSRNNTLHHFWPEIYSDWAKLWPELGVLVANKELPLEAKLPSADDPSDGTAFVWTDEYTEIYQDALYLRKKRIREWMSNNRRSALGLASLESSVPSLLATTLVKGGRGRQLREVYQHMYKDEITMAVEAELKTFPNPNPAPKKPKKKKGKGPIVADDAPPPSAEPVDPNAPPQMTDKAYKLKIRQAVVKRMWDEADENTKEAVRIEREKENAARLHIPDDNATTGLQRDPEDRQRSLNALGPQLGKLFKDIYDLCGWSSLCILVGPNPATKESLSVKTFSFAHETAPSATFPNVYAGYEENYITPLVEWCKDVYPKHLRGGKKNAALDNAVGPSITLLPAADNAEGSNAATAPIRPASEIESRPFQPKIQPNIAPQNIENDDDAASLSLGGDSDDELPEIASIGLGGLHSPPAHAPSMPQEIAMVSHLGPSPVRNLPLLGQNQPAVASNLIRVDQNATDHSIKLTGSHPIDAHPGGPTEPIAAAFDRMGQVYQPPRTPRPSDEPRPLPVPLLIWPSTAQPPIDPALLDQPEDALSHRPHMMNFGSQGLPHTQGGARGGRGGRGRGGARGRGRGGQASGNTVSHIAEALLLAERTQEHGLASEQDNGPSLVQPPVAAVPTFPEGGEVDDASINSMDNNSSNANQVTMPSRAARARVKALNDAWKAESERQDRSGSEKPQGRGRGKKGKSGLFNPDGNMPLVVLPPLDFPARGLASERPQRERRPPSRFDNSFDLPEKPKKRSAKDVPTEGEGSGHNKRGRKK